MLSISGLFRKRKHSENDLLTMATRREFIQMTIAASTVWLTRVTTARSNADAQAGPRSKPRVLPYRFVVDDRFPESVAAGRAAAEDGVTVHGMKDGDITPFWYHELSLRWKEEPVVIAGVTAHGPLFVLERLAWDHGMRVLVRETVPRTMNTAGDDEPLFSWLIGPRTELNEL
jgi:hypothetical protein